MTHYNPVHKSSPRHRLTATDRKTQTEERPVSSSVVVNLRLSPEDFEATKAKAEREERTASAVIRRALRLHLADDSDQPAERGQYE